MRTIKAGSWWAILGDDTLFEDDVTCMLVPGGMVMRVVSRIDMDQENAPEPSMCLVYINCGDGEAVRWLKAACPGFAKSAAEVEN